MNTMECIYTAIPSYLLYLLMLGVDALTVSTNQRQLLILPNLIHHRIYQSPLPQTSIIPILPLICSHSMDPAAVAGGGNSKHKMNEP